MVTRYLTLCKVIHKYLFVNFTYCQVKQRLEVNLETLFTALLWTAAISCGVMAGVYFAFSAFVMKSLSKIPAASAIAAMQSINKVIVSSTFLPLFLGSTVASLILVGQALFDWTTEGTLYAAVGGAFYLIGMTGCTMVYNVPLNNKLAALNPGTRESSEFWHSYLHNWTRWNHVRTAASTAAALLFTYAISLN